MALSRPRSLSRELLAIRTISIMTLITIQFNLLYGQDNQDTIRYSFKGEYKEVFPHRITARVFYTNMVNSYVFRDRNSNLRLEVEPNKQDRIGASVSCDFITLSYSFVPDFLA